MGSSRLPGKPLKEIEEIPMIEHVYRRSELSEVTDETYVATPDAEIRDEVERFGGKAIMTGEHTRPQERVAEASKSIDTDVVINVHGDEPLVHPDLITNSVTKLTSQDESVACCHVGTEIQNEDDFIDQNNVKIALGKNNDIIYYSRNPIPKTYDADFEDISAYKQVGVTAYQKSSLTSVVELEQTPLERAEAIFYLRLLENDYSIKFEETHRDIYTVDTKEDLDRVNEMMKTDRLYKQLFE